MSKRTKVKERPSGKLILGIKRQRRIGESKICYSSTPWPRKQNKNSTARTNYEAPYALFCFFLTAPFIAVVAVLMHTMPMPATPEQRKPQPVDHQTTLLPIKHLSQLLLKLPLHYPQRLAHNVEP